MSKSSRHRNKKFKYAATGVLISDKPDLKGDWLNIFILLLLYTLQGLQLGLTNAIPILLQSNKNVTYQDQVSRVNNQIHIVYTEFLILFGDTLCIKFNKLCSFVGCI